MIGKPYSGKLNVRFDEGELEIGQSSLRQFPALPFPTTLEVKSILRVVVSFRI